MAQPSIDAAPLDPIANLRTPHEARRVRALHALEIFDTPQEATFDRFARLAQTLFDAPVSTISLIDNERQFYKAAIGCDRESMSRGESFCGWTIAQDDPLIVPDLKKDRRFISNPRVVGPPYYRFYAGAPLTNRDGLSLGALCCLDFRPRKPAREKIGMLQDLAQMVVEAMDWRALATTDSLTGAMTRRAFLEAARRDVAQASRHGRLLTCLVLDIDHFKLVNDTYGHAAGDQVLRRVSALCREELRQSDYIGRLGGEEFALFLRDTPVSGALQVAERLRRRIADEVVVSEGRRIKVTISVGLSSLRAGLDTDALIAAADGALYAAKHGGRNRTMMERDAIARLVATR